uniref:V-set domain containing T-cell activation inhibitor 1-like n=1 Tax=Sinocyclocheilus grahami TaxID=75366 RepID=A0A672QEA5_SINGR
MLILCRCWVIYLLLHLTGKVSLQDFANKFDRVVGDSVTLPCIYKLQSTDVFWRHNVSRKVVSIISGKPSPESQDEIFRNRTESFPSEYPEGNYSIELKDLELTHAGIYTCFLQKTNEKRKIQLFVREKPEKPTPNQRNSSMETQSLKIMPFLIAVLGLTLHLI